HHESPTRRAWRWIPFGAVRLLLEIRTRHVLHLQILRVVDERSYHQPLIAISFFVNVPILRQHGVGTVRHAVLSQISGAHVGRDDLQIAVLWRIVCTAGCRRTDRRRTATLWNLPLSRRVTLPRRFPRGWPV